MMASGDIDFREYLQFEHDHHLAIATGTHFHGHQINLIIWMAQIANSYFSEIL